MAALHGLQVEDARARIGMEPVYYFRHPAGGVVALAWLRDVGLDADTARFLPLLATTLGLFFFFLFLREATGRSGLALAGLVLLALASPYYLIADSYQLYSYALGAKALGFWLTARAARRAGRAVAIAMLSGGIVAFVAVVAFGLETQPAVGLFGFLFPLICSRDRRVLRAIGNAGALAGGMAAGWFVRLVNILPCFDGDWGRMIDHFRTSFWSRSVRDFEVSPEHGREYAADLAWRFLDYVPLHLAAAAAALALWGLSRWRPSRRPPAVGVAVVALVAEGLYFVVMRRHAYLHVHTAVHLTSGLAALGAVGVAGLARLSPRPRVVLAAAGALFLVAPLRVPLEPYGNLLTDWKAGPVVEAVDHLTGLVAEDAVFLVPGRHVDSRLGYALAHAGRTWIARIEVPRPTTEEQIAKVVAATSRPCFALCREQEAEREELARLGRFVARRGPYLLFAVGNYRVEDLPPVEMPVTRPMLEAVALVAPEPAAVAAAGLTYPLVRPLGEHLWLHAPPRKLGEATVARLPLTGISGEAHSFRFDVEYAGRPEQKQPRLVLEIEGIGADGRGRPGNRFRAELEPGTVGREFVVVLPDDLVAAALDFRLAIAPDDRRTNSPRLLVRHPRVELR
ncbi:MAG: hypothetical protein R3F20_15565 [Planctomycetota bacterium]